MTATMTVQEATVTTAISTEIVRSEPYTHVVPGTYTPAGSETFQIVELRIGHEIVGVEIHGATSQTLSGAESLLARAAG